MAKSIRNIDETYEGDNVDLFPSARLIIRTPKYWKSSAQALIDFPEMEQKILSDIENRYGKLICPKCNNNKFRVSGMYDFEVDNPTKEMRKYSLSCTNPKCGKLVHYWEDFNKKQKLVKGENVLLNK
jgi:hypothetical protein